MSVPHAAHKTHTKKKKSLKKSIKNWLKNDKKIG